MEGDYHSSSGKRFKSGFVAIIGAPNVGKSTLLNQLLGEKVAIITPKPQTTRRQIKGILTGENFQIVFVDTPGIHESKRLLNRLLLKWATDALEDVDVILFLVDISKRDRIRDLAILDMLKGIPKPVIMVLNKIDKVAKENLLPIIDEYRQLHPFEAIIPISAKYSDGIDRVLDEILRLLPEGPQYFDGATITDQTPEEIAAELVREKVFFFAKEELPYSTAVKVEEFRDEGDRVYIRANIYVERPSQKGIIIGHKGKFLKKIGQMAREELESMWHKKVYLDLWVKVMKNWSKDERALRDLGLTT